MVRTLAHSPNTDGLASAECRTEHRLGLHATAADDLHRCSSIPRRATRDLTGADLSNARLNGVNFVGANLSGANLKGADLTGAILLLPVPPDAGESFDYQAVSGDQLIDAILQTPLSKMVFDPLIVELNELNIKALLKDALLQGVIYDDLTIWPLGFEVPATAIKSP